MSNNKIQRKLKQSRLSKRLEAIEMAINENRVAINAIIEVVARLQNPDGLKETKGGLIIPDGVKECD